MVGLSNFVLRKNRLPGLGKDKGFTLIEMMVATVILVLIVGILFTITQETSTVWKNTTGKVEIFKSARTGFEVMTRMLSQATLNTYYDYATTSGGTYTFVSIAGNTPPTTYARNSDLQFVSDLGSNLISGLSNYTPVTHAVFFQSPLGMVSSSNYTTMNGLMNACGFYVAYGPDISRPTYMAPLSRYRFRLMQFTQPSENLNIYAQNTYPNGTRSNLGTHNWFLPAIQADAAAVSASPPSDPTSTFVLAENIVALIVLPKLSVNDETAAETAYSLTAPLGTALAPNYKYDSSIIGQGGALLASGLSSYPLLNSFNQLPPVVQVTMVALDEASAIKLSASLSDPTSASQAATKIGLTGLFTQSKNLQTDLQTLEKNLSATPGNLAGNTVPYGFKVFQTDVAIRDSKWTSDN